MFKQRLLSSSIAAVTALGGLQMAHAQETQDGALEEIVVTGVRASLEKGLDIKRASFQIVDSIVAEDIGKFPDNNVVEALQRVSGVQVTDRGAGEVSTVSIRGLTDVSTTVNGRQIFTASGRSVALADIPASLLKSVDVYKTRSASQLESGIAGQIDIHTQRPFDFDGSKVVIAARGIYQEQAESTDPNLSGLFSNRWETSVGEFGALVNFSYAETNYRDQNVAPGAAVPFAMADAPANMTPYQRIRPMYTENGSEPWAVDPEYWGVPIWTPGLEQGVSTEPGSTMVVGGEEAEYLLSRDAIFENDFTGERKRPAANVSLQFAPNDSSEYLFEAFYNGYRNTSFNSLNFSFVDAWGDASGLPNGGAIEVYDGTNVVKSREVAAPYGFTSGDLTESSTDSLLVSLGGKWDISDRFRLESEVYWQRSEYETDFIAMRLEHVNYGLTVDFNEAGGMPEWAFYDNPETADIDESDLTDMSQWYGAQLYDNGGSSEGDAITWDIDGELDVDWGAVNLLAVGLRYDKRGASETTRGQDGYLGWLMTSAASLPEGMVTTTTGFFDGRANIPTAWAVPNGYYLSDHIDEVRALYGLDAEVLEETFEIDEATTSLYAQANFDTQLFGRVLDGQFGLRYVAADTDMTFYDVNVDPGLTGYKSSANASSSSILPSFVARYHLTDDLLARFSYAETVRRPAFNQLNSFIYYYDDVTNIGYGTASGGNPDLKPVESQNYDISLEWYFNDASALYGTLFRRDIEGFVYSSVRRVTYQAPDADEPYPYILTQPDNSSNGVLEGAELGVVYFPENLPGLLDGFGIQASYTLLDSEQEIPEYNEAGEKIGMTDTPMFGVSDSSYSVVLAYDKNDVDMRLSYVWRDDFLNNYEARQFANPLGVYRKAETSMDFQASYDVTDNLLVTFDATNLTDEEYQSYYENADIFNLNTAIYSRTFALGARYSF